MVFIDKKSHRPATARGQDPSLQAEPRSLAADDLPLLWRGLFVLRRDWCC